MKEESTRADLADALQGLLDSQAPKPPPTPPRRKRTGPLWIAFAVLVWGILAALWVTRPDAVFGNEIDLADLPPAEREAAARFALYLQHSRVVEFEAEQGRLPGSLAEAGDVEREVEYRLRPKGFVLSADGLRLSNTMNADSFLGDALSRLRPNRNQ